MAKQNRRARGPGRLSAEETAKLEDQLVDAAQAVFFEQGYARATVDAIAKKAGATRKTIYARYANKEEIFAAVVNRLIDAQITVPSLDPSLQSADARTRILSLAYGAIDFVDTEQMALLNRLLFAEGHKVPELARVSGEIYNNQLATVIAVLKPLHEAGILPTITDFRATAIIFVESVSSTARLRAVLGPATGLTRKQLEHQTEQAVDLFMRGCGFKPVR